LRAGDGAARLDRARRVIASARCRAALGLAVLVGIGSVSTTMASFTDGVATSGATTLSAAPFFTCAAATQPSSNAWGAWPLNEASGATTAADISGNGRSATYSSTSGITYRVAGPCPRDGAKAVTLDGSSSYLYTGNSPATIDDPEVFSVEIWFKTTVAQGRLIGLGTSQIGWSPNLDRHLYLTSAGNLAFGVRPGTTYKTVTSPSTYTDGQWHHAVATLAPSTNANPGQRLYVDGALVASDPSSTAAHASNLMLVRIGYDNLTGWPNAPSSFYFKGSLAFAAFYVRALTPTEVSAHYRVGQ
jgi:hypothetical protein